MKIQIMSDLHLEMHADKGVEFINSLDPAGVDVLVLAGDICGGKYKERLDGVFSRVSVKYPNAIYVPGNHEYYGTNPTTVWENINAVAALYHNVHVLNNESIYIGAQRFIGGTGWFPYNAYADSVKQFMNDFRIIKDFEPWVYDQNRALDLLLHGELLESDVVVTHHLPSQQCIVPKYRLSPLNAFFLSEFDDLILEKKPKLWIHGHTHSQIDLNIGPTRIVANPLGYPSEQFELMSFQDRFLIEV